MLLSGYLKHVIAEHLGGDAKRFDELWELVPEFSSQLRGFDSGSEWLHWQPRTFDGWYCLPEQDGYVVYRQERGVRDEFTRFGSEREAVRFAIDTAVLSLAT